MEKVQHIFPPRIDLLRSDEGQLKPSNRASVVGSTLAAGVGAIRESRSKEPLHPASEAKTPNVPIVFDENLNGR